MTTYTGSASYIIPLQATSNQMVSCVLNGQFCQIRVYQKTTGLFLDLFVNNLLIVGGVQCLWGTWLILNNYLGFSGDLCWMDTQGEIDPICTGIGSRWFLFYVPSK